MHLNLTEVMVFMRSSSTLSLRSILEIIWRYYALVYVLRSVKNFGPHGNAKKKCSGCFCWPPSDFLEPLFYILFLIGRQTKPCSEYSFEGRIFSRVVRKPVQIQRFHDGEFP